MAKTIVVKLKRAGNKVSLFNISDDRGNILGTNIPKQSLIDGITYSVEDSVKTILLQTVGACCNKHIEISIGTATIQQLAAIKFIPLNTATIWVHLLNPVIYNTYYGCINPYIIEYPFSYKFQDEILQNIKDYTKSYRYFPNDDGVFFDDGKVEINEYFNKAILYNGQQSSGILNLVAKPKNNLSDYLKYPMYFTDSKTITYTKSDNFYQYNTFWSLLKDITKPAFIKSCESVSIDKIVNQSNMDYSKRSFKKSPLRAKDLKTRHILDDKSDLKLVSQFIIGSAMISYK